jgi:sugar lactone lactonase YvrE
MNMNKYISFLLLSCLILGSCNNKQTNETKKTETMKDSLIVWQAELILDAKAKLGEGAIWYPHEKALYWIDIVANELHIFDPATEKDLKYELPNKPGTVIPLKNGNSLIAMDNGIFEWNKKDNSFTFFAENPEKEIGSRYNDGKCDPSGRLWVGTYAEDVKQCALYRIEADKSITKMVSDVTTSNGIAWSLDKTKMYYIDTPTRMVQQFDYDDKTGEISNKKIIINFEEGIGNPDGSTLDAEGMLWIAHWGGACVSRWNPQTGQMIGKVEVPCLQVTSVAFGGEDLSTLYITTVREWLDDETLEKYPNSGGLFAVKPGVKGISANYFEQ